MFFCTFATTSLNHCLSGNNANFKTIKMTRNFAGWSLMIATAFFALTASAQAPHKCGVTIADGQKIKEQMFQNRNEMRDFVRERNAVTYVPVRFLLVAKSDGTGRASERAGLQALCLLNEHYADQDIQFYLKEFKYVNSTSIYSSPMSFSGSNAIANQMIYNAMNIFLVNEMDEEGVLGYYQPEAGPQGNDWIVALENYAGEKLVLTHEVGHFFSLNHTFYGWEESGGWDPAIHGNPVGPNSPAGWPNELVNGTNCNTPNPNNCGGDCICDTPADYMFPNNNCGYTQNAKDPNGQLLNPDHQNFMNYVYGCSDYHFSDGQKEEISNSLFSSSRNYIRPNYTPNLATVSGAPTIISPQQSETIDTYNAVPLEWTALPGADKYLIELTTSGQPTKRYVVNSNSVVLTDLLPSKSYLWKVLGYNEYSTCGTYSGQKIFKTGDQLSDTADTPGLESWSINPNPVELGSPFYINVNTTIGTDANISILSLTGQLVKQMSLELAPGESNVEIETGNLTAGFYLVNLSTESGSKTLRLSIVE